LSTRTTYTRQETHDGSYGVFTVYGPKGAPSQKARLVAMDAAHARVIAADVWGCKPADCVAHYLWTVASGHRSYLELLTRYEKWAPTELVSLEHPRHRAVWRGRGLLSKGGRDVHRRARRSGGCVDGAVGGPHRGADRQVRGPANRARGGASSQARGGDAGEDRQSGAAGAVRDDGQGIPQPGGGGAGERGGESNVWWSAARGMDSHGLRFRYLDAAGNEIQPNQQRRTA
jgi:hypothetical protein